MELVAQLSGFFIARYDPVCPTLAFARTQSIQAPIALVKWLFFEVLWNQEFLLETVKQ